MQWVPTFTLFLILYPLGWLISHFCYFFDRNISSNNLSIIGTLITFFLFLQILPSWGQTRWKTNQVWLYIGLDFRNKLKALKIFLNGFFWSVLLLLMFFLFIYLFGWVEDYKSINLTIILNALLLIIGIVFAEELIFRGWLMEEMIVLFGYKKGIVIESAIFSLAHFRADIGLVALIPFLGGLFLFGLVLTLRRIIDKGSLWGTIGLHGGLVGIWYLFDSGLIKLSNETPYYLLGPSQNMINPIGGIFGINILLIIIFFQRRLFSRTGRFFTETD
tara:strand:- start:148 stop:972 length:825 start_codon:yes stop_codon:yes gene_type:complete